MYVDEVILQRALVRAMELKFKVVINRNFAVYKITSLTPSYSWGTNSVIYVHRISSLTVLVDFVTFICD